jgi:iron uptake system EfeUOB component EfeO/EfeM
MAVSPLGISEEGAPDPRPRPWRRHALLALGVLGLAVIALLAAALIPSGSSPSKRFSVAALAGHVDSANHLKTHETKVFGSNIPAKQYGTQIADLEDQGIDTNGQLTSDLAPLPPSSFDGPIAAYRSYAERWAATLQADLPALRQALAGGGRAASERAWAVAWSDYLRLGAVYGLLPGTLDAQIDGMPHALPGDETGEAAARFSGLHRIEYGLWTGASPRSLVPWAAKLQRDAVTLRRALPSVQITPLDYATRAHEILEDAQRDLLSGMDVQWSGAGVLGTAAGLTATQEVIGTLTPLLQGRDNTLAEVDAWLPQLQAVLSQLRKAHHGTYPSLGQLTTAEYERLDGTMAETLGALALVPGTLETTSLPVIPKIPSAK